MRLLKFLIISEILFILAPGYVGGQNVLFKDISYFHDSLSYSNNILIYFHFKECPPCKKMNEHVFNNLNVSQFLRNNFLLYEVFGFDSLETKYRNEYKVKSNPGFIILDSNRKLVHKFVGYYNSVDFLRECRKVSTGLNLTILDSIYLSDNIGNELFRSYILAKDLANDLDSSLVFEYFNELSKNKLKQRNNFIDLLHYGYYRFKWIIPVNSRYYDVIEEVYNDSSFIQYNSLIRNRLLFSLVIHVNKIRKLDNELYLILNKMKQLENGKTIVLEDIYEDNVIHAAILDPYPSFYEEYDRTLKYNNKIAATNVLRNHVERIKADHRELNNIAWAIYERKLNEDISIGVDIIELALSQRRSYHYLDTYVALLLKNGNYDHANAVALEAVEVAKKMGLDYKPTIKLLEKFNQPISSYK